MKRKRGNREREKKRREECKNIDKKKKEKEKECENTDKERNDKNGTREKASNAVTGRKYIFFLSSSDHKQER